ncbi:uncharacterized protein LOC115634773 isoform X1 [Scaptodrosophila lebanonensis]|uniref:Uncharacterized protein LOC115634773 isoform X1 n=1 Tax=Drosophila lebanonensis TaxID=7225 RepID=A0A6J2UM91_DROLE|nr:uncharacterized protein LOC115634773 isoform X1 [Scaptodrosophila lebanonensis]
MGTPTSELAMALDIPSPSGVGKGQAQVEFTGTKFEIDSSISEEERRFYHKLFPTVDLVNQRKVHCTVCRTHIGTAPSVEGNIKMHPILRVTHCVKCHDFYNSGEFSKGEDGSELYCRWCGQGGEVYCCSTCPFVFCKSCIIKNLSRGVINDIEQNENWNCFKCTSKILWPLRAQHWALINYIEAQKKGIKSLQLPEAEARSQMMKDNSTCCRLAKSRASGMSDSMESIESNASKRSHSSSVNSTKKPQKTQGPPTKRPKSSNDEVVCTPDLLSMLEPDCQISLPQTTVVRQVTPSANITTTPRIVTVQQNYTGPSSATGTNGGSAATSMPRSNAPPPLVPSSTGIRYRGPNTSSLSVVRRTLVAPMAARNPGPVFHTINGFRVDLNSAAQQESYRLPNGRLIQVKRQVPAASTTPQQPRPITPAPLSVGPQVVLRQRQPLPSAALRQGTNGGYGSNMGIYNPQPNPQPRMPHLVRLNNGAQMQSVPVQVQPQPQPQPQMPGPPNGAPVVLTPVGMRTSTLVRHIFPNDAIGSARTRLQEQIFNAMEICTHLTGKVQTLTNSNAYNSARSYLDLKELYIHLSYLMTYAIGRFKGLQDKCLADMRDLGFKNDANSLENGQLAAEKQASDDEDNEIEIVEPKTDTITIDSDNEEEAPSTSTSNASDLKITSVTSTAPESTDAGGPEEFLIDVSSFTTSILASMLEVDITEGNGNVKKRPLASPGGTVQKKQPRKKTTNKRNPALLQLERERMEETKRTDRKLKMKVVVKLKRVEEYHPIARKWAEQMSAAKTPREPTGAYEVTDHSRGTSYKTNKTDADEALSKSTENISINNDNSGHSAKNDNVRVRVKTTNETSTTKTGEENQSGRNSTGIGEKMEVDGNDKPPLDTAADTNIGQPTDNNLSGSTKMGVNKIDVSTGVGKKLNTSVEESLQESTEAAVNKTIDSTETAKEQRRDSTGAHDKQTPASIDIVVEHPQEFTHTVESLKQAEVPENIPEKQSPETAAEQLLHPLNAAVENSERTKDCVENQLLDSTDSAEKQSLDPTVKAVEELQISREQCLDSTETAEQELLDPSTEAIGSSLNPTDTAIEEALCTVLEKPADEYISEIVEQIDIAQNFETDIQQLAELFESNEGVGSNTIEMSELQSEKDNLTLKISADPTSDSGITAEETDPAEVQVTHELEKKTGSDLSSCPDQSQSCEETGLEADQQQITRNDSNETLPNSGESSTTTLFG